MNIFHLPRFLTSITSPLLVIFWPFVAHAGGGYISDECNLLVDKTSAYLLTKGYCSSERDCYETKSVFFYIEESTRIYLNIYNQRDNVIVEGILNFFLDEGLKITKGKEISLGVFREPHAEYEKLSNAFFIRRHAAIELEISQ